MDHPDKPAAVSTALAGEVQTEPEEVTAVVVSDRDDNPAGVLEKWSDAAWIYADADALQELD